MSPPTTTPRFCSDFIVIGEVLFDRFPDGARVLGGAPFNVAWHLTGFGYPTRLVTRIGDDAPGREILAAMSGWGLATADVQVDPSAPTGQVRITHGRPEEPAYEITPDQAFDRINADIQPPPSAESMLYHGTLALRSEGTRRAVAACVAAGGPVFVDCNLRPPWWTRASVEDAVASARWLKLNHDELETILATLGRPSTGGTVFQSASELRDLGSLDEVVVTIGSEGALAVGSDGPAGVDAPPTEVVDSVGAGDAFSAVLILGIVRGWDLPTRLRRAAEFAARVCGERGALIHDRSVYDEILAGWNLR